MKKFLIVTMMVVCAAMVAAQTTPPFNGVLITLTNTNTSKSDAVQLIECSEFSSEFEDSYDVVKFLTGGTIYTYAITTHDNQSVVFDNTLNDLPIGYWNNTASAATLKFTFGDITKQVGDFVYYLKDKTNDSLTIINSFTSYEFTVAANERNDNRFQIVKPADPTICHQYGNLIITGHVGEKVKVLDMDGEVAIAEQTIDTDSKVIELTSLTSGEQYQVVVGDKTMIIRVQ